MHSVKKAGLLLRALSPSRSPCLGTGNAGSGFRCFPAKSLGTPGAIESPGGAAEDLEAQVARLTNAPASQPPDAALPAKTDAAPSEAPSAEVAPPAVAATVEATPAPAPQSEDAHEHSMKLPGGGPVLKIRGFADFNLGFGSDANPLIFPLPAPVHNTFQIGEFDLFLSSRLSRQVSFLSELVIGADQNELLGSGH